LPVSIRLSGYKSGDYTHPGCSPSASRGPRGRGPGVLANNHPLHVHAKHVSRPSSFGIAQDALRGAHPERNTVKSKDARRSAQGAAISF